MRRESNATEGANASPELLPAWCMSQTNTLLRVARTSSESVACTQSFAAPAERARVGDPECLERAGWNSRLARVGATTAGAALGPKKLSVSSSSYWQSALRMWACDRSRCWVSTTDPTCWTCLAICRRAATSQGEVPQCASMSEMSSAD